MGYTVGIWNPNIWNPETLKSGLFDGQILNGPVFIWLGFRFGHSFGPNHSKSGHFCPDFKCFWQDGGHLPGFQMFLTKWRPFVWISNVWAYRFHFPFPSGPFATQPLFDHLKFRLVQIQIPTVPDWSFQYSNGNFAWIIWISFVRYSNGVCLVMWLF